MQAVDSPSAISPVGAVTVTEARPRGEKPVAGSKMWWSLKSAEKAML